MNAWDCGVNWRSSIVTAPTDLVVSVAYVRDKVLRVSNGSEEDGFIERALWTATRACERATGRAVPFQRRAWIADRFPAGKIVVPAPPFVAPVSLEYVDADGVTQELAVSPIAFQVVPSGRVSKAEIVPLYGEVWPATRCQPDAVTLTYDCGYENEDDVPQELISGICLMVGELYKQRTLSQVGTSIVEAPLDTTKFWPTVF